MGFPPANAEVYYNDAGELLGGDIPAQPEDFYCDYHGFSHGGSCEEIDARYDPYASDEDDLYTEREYQPVDPDSQPGGPDFNR